MSENELKVTVPAGYGTVVVPAYKGSPTSVRDRAGQVIARDGDFSWVKILFEPGQTSHRDIVKHVTIKTSELE